MVATQHSTFEEVRSCRGLNLNNCVIRTPLICATTTIELLILELKLRLVIDDNCENSLKRKRGV
jgi:hypothetical protein